MQHRIGVVWNLAAGQSSRYESVAARIRELFAPAACDVEVLTSAHGPELAEAGSRFLRNGCNILVAAGGDGTVSSLASLLVGNSAALGVLPVGTLNHFARDLAIPSNLEAASRVILAGRSRAIDVGELNGRYFINNSSLGLYPSIVRRREHWEKTGYSRFLAFTAAFFVVFRRYPFLDLALRADGQAFSRRSPFVFIGNNEYETEGLGIGRRLHLDRGQLALYTAHRTGRLGLLRIAGSALFRRLRRNHEFEILSARELVIDTPRKRVRVALDGEVTHMRPPLRYRICPGVLRVITPV